MSIGYTSTDPSGGAGLPGPVGTVVYYVTGGVASLMIKWGTGSTNWATATPGLTSGGLTTTDPRGGAGLAGPITSQIYYVTGGVATLLVKWGTGDTNWALTAPAVPAGTVPTSRIIGAGTGLTGGGDLSADRTLTLANTAVTPGSYTLSSITVDQQGRLTAASSGSASAAYMFDVAPALLALTNAGNENDVNFGPLGKVTLCRFGTTLNEHITGVSNNGTTCAAGDDGRVICLYNGGTGPGVGYNAVINNESALSAAGNRMITAGGGIINIILGQGIFFRYDSTDLRWKQITS